MLAHHVITEAAYSVLLLADNAVSDGDITSASRWLDEARDLVSHESDGTMVHAAYYSASAAIAILEGRLAHAMHLIDEADSRFPSVALPRYKAFVMAVRVKAELSTKHASRDSNLSELRRLYALGRCLGGQDFVVEALWAAARAEGRDEDASTLLREYMTRHRRELGPPDASLLATTASDSFWKEHAKGTAIC
jgi:hypothetical protein